MTLTSPEVGAVFTEPGELALTGEAPRNATLTITSNGATLGSLTVTQRPWRFTYALDQLSEGAQDLKVACVAPSGTTSEASVSVEVDLDAPPLRVDDMDPASNTVEGNPTVRGTTTPESPVTLTITREGAAGQETTTVTLTANAAGGWSHTPDPALSPGTYTFAVSAPLPSGRGLDTNALSLTILPAPRAALESDRCTTASPHAPIRHTPWLLVALLGWLGGVRRRRV